MVKDNRPPSNTVDLIKYLEDIYTDLFELDPAMVGTPEYWKKAGVIELIQLLKSRIE